MSAEPCATSLTDWIQAVSVPVSLVVSWLIFKVGVAAESSRFAREKEFESIESSLSKLTEIETQLELHLTCTDSDRFYYTSAKFQESLRQFSVSFNRYSDHCRDTHKELSDLYFEIHSASTSHPKFNTPSKIKATDRELILRETNTQVRAIRNRIENVRGDYLKKLRGNKLKSFFS